MRLMVQEVHRVISAHHWQEYGITGGAKPGRGGKDFARSPEAVCNEIVSLQ